MEWFMLAIVYWYYSDLEDKVEELEERIKKLEEGI